MNSTDLETEIQGEPRTLAQMDEELKKAVADASAFIIQQMDSYSIRKCLWAGQSDDGLKNRDAMDKEPFPWDGASDTRIRLADEIINDNVIIKVNAMMRSKMQAVSTESGDTKEAGAMTVFLKWLFGTKMKEIIRREPRLLCNWTELYGHAIMAITWDQEIRFDKKEILIQDLQAMGEQMAKEDPKMAAKWQDMLLAVFDPTRDEETLAWLRSLESDLKLRDARKALKSLREQGMFEISRPTVIRSQPCWTACRPYRDVFYPANTTTIETARWVAYRECLSPADLRGRIHTDEYDEDAVETVIKTCLGQTVMSNIAFPNNLSEQRTKLLFDELDGLLEVFCFYERVSDDEGGIKIKKTVFVSDSGEETPLWEGDNHYKHNQYPFVESIRWQTERLMIENDGVPELVSTHQNEIKQLRDYRSDRASIAILPPMEIPQTRQNNKVGVGPRSQIPVRRRGEYGFLEIPRLDPDAVVAEQQIRADVNSYFGRWVEGVHPSRMSLYSQAMVDDFLGVMEKAAKQTVMLARQYWNDELFARVTGVQVPFQLTDGDDYNEEFDISLQFNAADLDLEVVFKKLDAITKVLPLDTMGQVNHGVIIDWAMSAIDYSLVARGAVKPEEEATNAEIEDEQVQFTKIAAGVEPPMKEGGQNFGLRLNVLDSIIKANPALQQRYQQDEIFKKLVDSRAKHFAFQLQQRENAQIGRIGAAPVLGGNGQ